MNITPFNNLVLVDPIGKQDEEKASGIFIPDKHIGRYMRYKVLAVGDKVTWMKPGDIVLGNPTPDNETVNNKGHKLINSADLFARVEE